jgi:hypothetical protein
MTAVTPELEAMARAMEPSAFATYDAGYTQRNGHDLRAFLNAERTVKAARRKARAALLAIREPTPAMLQGACDKHIPRQPMSAERDDECSRFQTRRRLWGRMIDAILGTIAPDASTQVPV